MIAKVQRSHTEKPAYIYIRQSTMAQVRHHQESTERQYALREKAMLMGWAEDLIRVLDGDLGVSGAQTAGRNDFKLLVADVSMRKVGAVFALEASRLARSCADWHRLLELCAFTGTLIIDEDGCYNPADFNDQLLLGLKGTMSQAELHFLRGRLQGGRLNKARKGELRSPLPVGFVYDEAGRTVRDPDAEVQQAVRFLFDTFQRTGSAYAVVHAFAQGGFRFPKRSYGGAWDGRLIWGRLTDGRVLSVLKNPGYAGVYVHGRYQASKEITPDGSLRSRAVEAPMTAWTVTIRDHHEGYISWEMFLQNKATLAANRTNGDETLLGGPAREGLAILQGLLICGQCGRRLTVRYKGNGGIYPVYECNWRRREGLATTTCLSLRCDLADGPVAARLLEVMQLHQIEIAIKAYEELARRQGAVDNRWRLRIQRAEYEADLAQRRYENVDPANRLVAANLEQRWNEALTKADETRRDYAAHRAGGLAPAGAAEKAQLLRLAQDLPAMWHAPATKDKDRKRLLRLLIKDITVERPPRSKRVMLHLRWQGGACESISVDLPPRQCDKIRYPEPLVAAVRKLAEKLTDGEIAAELNEAGQISAKGKPFSSSMVCWIRHKHRIPAPPLQRPEELTVQQVAERFAVKSNVVYYWIQHRVVTARKPNPGGPYFIMLDPAKDQELTQWVSQSVKLRRTIKPDSKTNL